MSKRLKLSLKGAKLKGQKCLGLSDAQEKNSATSSQTRKDVGQDYCTSTSKVRDQENIEVATAQQGRSNRNSSPLFRISTLDNLGNTCYLNSVVYVLRYVKEFRKHLHNLAYRHQELIRTGAIYDQQTDAQHTVILQLHELMRSMRHRELQSQVPPSSSQHLDGKMKVAATKPVKPVTFLESLRRANSIYDGSSQHDAHELLGFILNWTETTVNCFEQWSTQYSARRKSNRINKNRDIKFNSNCLSCPSQTIFEGENIVNTTCLECETVNRMEDKFRDISVPFLLTSKFETEQNIKNEFQMKVTMSGDDKVWCNNCHHYNEALHCSLIVKLPPILVLQLKHIVSYSELLNHTRKIQKESSTIPKVLPCLLDSCSSNCTARDHRFYIGAIVCHIGSTLDSGHYTVYLHENMTLSDLKPVATEISDEPVIPQKRASRQYNSRKCITRSNSLGDSATNDYITNDLVCSLDECCEPLSYQTDDRWLYFDDDKLEVIEDFPEFNAEHSSETPYLLFYYRG